MRKIIYLLVNSEIYKNIKSIITIDGEKRFIISSLAYYMLLSLLPMCALIYYFLRFFNIEENFIISIVNAFLPNYKNEYTFTIKDFFSNGISMVISMIVGTLTASKGILNYYYYLDDKFKIKPFPYQFFLNRLYVGVLTIIASIVFSIISSIGYYFSQFSYFFLIFIARAISIFLSFTFLLFLNYFILKAKIPLIDLAIGSFISSLLFNISSLFLQYYMNSYSSKEKYYGILTNYLIYILFIYLLSYCYALGNQINFFIYTRKYKWINNVSTIF